MAVNTAQKRFSMMGLGRVPSPTVFEPDGAVDADDRYSLLHLYSGISLSGAPTATIMAQARGVSRLVHGRIFGRIN